jgi:uncharacterized membrane protein
VGIAIPIPVPAVQTAIVAVRMARRNAAARACVLGTLIRADLLNRSGVPWLGAPVAAIGVRVNSPAYF